MSAESYRESPGKFDSRTLSRETLSRWTGRFLIAQVAGAAAGPDLGATYCTPEINNSEIIVDVQWHFPMD